jgi:SAM-dependent methyltransferase
MSQVDAVSQEACILCGGHLSPTSKPLPVGHVIGSGCIVVCERCGSGQIMPRSARGGREQLYDESYYDGSAGAGALAGGADEASSKLKRRLVALERRFEASPRLLDLGCATGVFVAYARDRGWRAIGIEPSDAAAELGRRTRQVEILTGTIETVDLPAASFEVIHANHVLEHLEDPIVTLRAAARLLAPAGVVVAEVPYELSTPLAERLLGSLGRPIGRPSSTYHLTFFSRRGLMEAIRHAGLRVESLRGEPRESASDGLSPVKRQALDVLYRAESLSRRPAALLVVAGHG